MTAVAPTGMWSRACTAQQPVLLLAGPSKLIVIAYNSGMASGNVALKSSWRADVQRLLRHNVLSIFTCANDHTDLKCKCGPVNCFSDLWIKAGARVCQIALQTYLSGVAAFHNQQSIG
eukprot:213604-Chlamydomonas_euryale.AAC.33